MHPIFIAHGPAFRKNITVPSFNNVDVYPLMCHILGIQPRPNDGSFENVKQLLAEADDDDDDVEYGSMLTCKYSMFLIFLCYIVFVLLNYNCGLCDVINESMLLFFNLMTNSCVLINVRLMSSMHPLSF